MRQEIDGRDRGRAPGGQERAGEIETQSDPRIQLPHSLQSGHVERDHCGQGRDTSAINLLEDFLFHLRIAKPALLDLDERHAAAPPNPMQDFRKRGDFEACVPKIEARRIPPVEPGARVEALEHADGHVRNSPAARCCPFKSCVVNDHRYAIRRLVNVKLDSVRALAEREIKRRQCVLRRSARGAAMADV